MSALVVRCRMYVTTKIEKAQMPKGTPPVVSVNLTPVYSKDNESWSKYTPSGSITLEITNPSASDALKVGQEYWIDFTPVADAQDFPKGFSGTRDQLENSKPE